MAETTFLNDIIDPQVLTDAVTAKIEAKIQLLPFVKQDDRLKGVPGSTVSIPKFDYIGPAVDVAEGEKIPKRKLTATMANYTIKKAGKGSAISDEAIESGYGNPDKQIVNQIATSIADKIEMDLFDAALTSKTIYTSDKAMSYETVVNAVDVLNEETVTEKIIFVHPHQVTQLRLDPKFISRDTYSGDVVQKGEIGMVAGCRVVSSRRVKKLDEWYSLDTSGALSVVADNGDDSTTVDLEKVLPSLPNAKVGDKVSKGTEPRYFNFIVKLSEETETDEETEALTLFKKTECKVEPKRDAETSTTEYYGTQHYAAALTNEEKVVVIKTLVDAPKV